MPDLQIIFRLAPTLHKTPDGLTVSINSVTAAGFSPYITVRPSAIYGYAQVEGQFTTLIALNDGSEFEVHHDESKVVSAIKLASKENISENRWVLAEYSDGNGPVIVDWPIVGHDIPIRLLTQIQMDSLKPYIKRI